VLRRLRLFQDLGHVAVLILGDFTALVGDPSGKSVTRPQLSKEEVDAHAQTYIEQAARILDESAERLEIRRNSEWLAAMDIADVLRITSQVDGRAHARTRRTSPSATRAAFPSP